MREQTRRKTLNSESIVVFYILLVAEIVGIILISQVGMQIMLSGVVFILFGFQLGKGKCGYLETEYSGFIAENFLRNKGIRIGDKVAISVKDWREHKPEERYGFVSVNMMIDQKSGERDDCLLLTTFDNDNITSRIFIRDIDDIVKIGLDEHDIDEKIHYTAPVIKINNA